MEEENRGTERHSLTSGETTAPSSKRRDANRARNNACVCKCNEREAYIIACVLVILSLFITAVSLIAIKLSRHSPYFASQNISSMDSWITYKGNYFYISKEQKTWSVSLKTCSLLNSSLAVIDTQEELDFWVHFLGPFDYWFGLSRETNKVWKWSNGTEFRNQFPIHGEGFCAYINAEGASSAQCSLEKGFLCSCKKVVAKLEMTTSSKVEST